MAVHLLGLGSEEDDRQALGRADEAGEREPVLARHHDVEQHEVDGVDGQYLARGGGILRAGDAQAVLAEIARQRIANVPLVVDQKDMGFIGHAPLVSGRRRAGRKPRRGMRRGLLADFLSGSVLAMTAATSPLVMPTSTASLPDRTQRIAARRIVLAIGAGVHDHPVVLGTALQLSKRWPCS